MTIKKISFLAIILIACLPFSGFSQARKSTSKKPVQVKKKTQPKTPQINLSFNRIFNGSLASFYDKLQALKKTDTGIVRVVHIGDSHIQADFLSSVVRTGLQKSFGNAGRGLVFPYQVASSNAPSDINSWSNTSWYANRLAHPEIRIGSGICGFCIQTKNPGTSFNLNIKANENGNQSFNKIQLFTDNAPGSVWQLQAGQDSLYSIKPDSTSPSLYNEVLLDTLVSDCIVSCLQADTARSFYGLSLENGKPGILYHTIGVNGARFDHYNETPLFWKQLPALKADLYIISLGTNEAQAAAFDAKAFEYEMKTFISRLKEISPNASVLITTAADSYKGKRSNMVLKQLNTFISNYCARNHIALWDLYRVTNGYGSARYWLKKGWMNKDSVHYLPEGYKKQGSLLLDVLEKGYQHYTSN